MASAVDQEVRGRSPLKLHIVHGGPIQGQNLPGVNAAKPVLRHDAIH